MKENKSEDQDVYDLVKQIPNEDKFYHLIKRLIEIQEAIEKQYPGIKAFIGQDVGGEFIKVE